jgi:hypothetical protein
MKLTLEEARQLGAAKLWIDRALFDKSLEVAKGLDGMRREDLGPMTLALAILGVSKAHVSDQGLAAELTDALALVAKAEEAWRMEQKFGRMH